jgi:outer membrane protein OmpA-like peptidoglycan-associated protein
MTKAQFVPVQSIYSLLREFAKALKGGLSDAQIKIAGHTDNIDTEAYN